MTSAALLEILASLTLQVAILIAICDWLARRTGDLVVRDRLWTLAHLLILALAAGSFLMPHLRWTALSAVTPAGWQPSLLAGFHWAGEAVGAVWLGGCLCYLGVLIRGMARGMALVRASSPPPEGWLPSVAAAPELAAGNGRERLRIRVSARVASPFLWQFHRAAIVLPATALAFPREEVRAILRHEVAHFRAGHPLQLFLQRLVEMLFWYHPLVWRASRATAAARELRCDWQAVGSAEEARTYLNSLIHLMESCQPAAVGLPAGLDFLGNSQFLRERTSALLRRFAPGEPPAVCCRPPRGRALGLACAALGCAVWLWLPLNPAASQRSRWSPWPSWSADALDSLGIQVRDYEVDGHRLTSPPHHEAPTARP